MILVLTTFQKKSEAVKIGKDLLKKRVIACYNLIPVESVYWWKGKIEEAKEFSRGLFSQLVATNLEREGGRKLIKALDEIQRLQSRVQELEAEQRWIPVSERLPDSWEIVLLATKFGVQKGCVYNSVTNDLVWTDGEYFMFEGVTHWRPLPQPPKDGDQ